MPGDGGGNDGVSRPESVKDCGDDGDGGDCACCDDGGVNDSVNGGDGCCVGDCVSGVCGCGDECFCCGEYVSFSKAEDADDCGSDIGTELSFRIGDCCGCC